mmetsp:Transcript_55108/g.141929  ORF Transcript_55108/g.141929 Transcript_55108/m.141929 type:complete len:303 (-) Transcript_55108:500-1408(-)
MAWMDGSRSMASAPACRASGMLAIASPKRAGLPLRQPSVTLATWSSLPATLSRTGFTSMTMSPFWDPRRSFLSTNILSSLTASYAATATSFIVKMSWLLATSTDRTRTPMRSSTDGLLPSLRPSLPRIPLTGGPPSGGVTLTMTACATVEATSPSNHWFGEMPSRATTSPSNSSLAWTAVRAVSRKETSDRLCTVTLTGRPQASSGLFGRMPSGSSDSGSRPTRSAPTSTNRPLFFSLPTTWPSSSWPGCRSAVLSTSCGSFMVRISLPLAGSTDFTRTRTLLPSPTPAPQPCAKSSTLSMP